MFARQGSIGLVKIIMKIINKNVGDTPNQLRLKLINNNQLSKKVALEED